MRRTGELKLKNQSYCRMGLFLNSTRDFTRKMCLESEFFLIVTKKKAVRVVHHKGDHGFSPSGGQIYISLMIETD